VETKGSSVRQSMPDPPLLMVARPTMPRRGHCRIDVFVLSDTIVLGLAPHALDQGEGRADA
jgi:hypothetical protein